MKVASENYQLSMARPDLLAAAKAAYYMPFVEKGKDAGYFGGDLLNVIGRRAVAMKRYRTVAIEDVDKDVYGQMLAVYRKNGNREAELLVMLDSIGHVARVSNGGVAEHDPDGVASANGKCCKPERIRRTSGCSPISVICRWRQKFICACSIWRSVRA